MITFHIEGSKESPAVIIDRNQGTVEIKGNSTLKNPSGFYKNLARWIHAFRMGNNPVDTVNIDLQEANALSVKWIGYIIDDIEKHPCLQKEKVKINWIYPLKENFFPVSSRIYKSLTCIRLKIVAA